MVPLADSPPLPRVVSPMIDNPIVPWRHTAANTYKIQANPAPIAFLHAAAGFPAKETWLHVVEANFYSSLSGISPPRVRRHLTELNILHPSRINPKISAYTQIHGVFGFNKTPLAPNGCKVVVHDRIDNRGTWSEYGTRGFYIRVALQHIETTSVTCQQRVPHVPATQSNSFPKAVPSRRYPPTAFR